MKNIFEHQLFMLRSVNGPSSGKSIKRSFREIICGPDEPLRFDYPQEHYNVAALCLCASLCQAIFEPKSLEELANRLSEPLSEPEFEDAVAPIRHSWSLDGVIRFMQGMESSKPNEHILVLDLTYYPDKRKGLLNRKEGDLVVELDQLGLATYTRNIFFEGMAGRGYKKGPNGDVEVRTLLIDPVSLRRSIWRNVLAREMLTGTFESHFHEGEKGLLSGFIWNGSLPKEEPETRILDLPAALLWMPAFHYAEIKEAAPGAVCMVTGTQVTGLCASGIFKKTSDVGYSPFFCGPWSPFEIKSNKSEEIYYRHIELGATSGITGHMGGLFFTDSQLDQVGKKVAPVVSQFHEMEMKGLGECTGNPLHLKCFGFYMLSQQKNVHGGFESEEFVYPYLNQTAGRYPDVLLSLRDLFNYLAETTAKIEFQLANYVQGCTLQYCELNPEGSKHRFSWKKKVPLSDLMPGASRRFWEQITGLLHQFLAKQIPAVLDDFSETEETDDSLKLEWIQACCRIAWDQFLIVYQGYFLHPKYMNSAFHARRILAGIFAKEYNFQFNDRPQQPILNAEKHENTTKNTR